MKICNNGKGRLLTKNSGGSGKVMNWPMQDGSRVESSNLDPCPYLWLWRPTTATQK